MSKVTLEIKLSEILGRHRIKQSELARAAGLYAAGLNRMFHNNRSRLEFDQVEAVLAALEQLSGRRYTLGDLIATNFEDDDEQPEPSKP